MGHPRHTWKQQNTAQALLSCSGCAPSSPSPGSIPSLTDRWERCKLIRPLLIATQRAKSLWAAPLPRQLNYTC